MEIKDKIEKRFRRHKRLRGKVFGTAKRPRLCVFRSNKHIYAQIINDQKKGTLAAASDLELKSKSKKKISSATPQKNKSAGGRKGKIAQAYRVGELVARKAIKENIKEVVFDRGGYKYHGRVKALAEGAREGGLKF